MVKRLSMIALAMLAIMCAPAQTIDLTSEAGHHGDYTWKMQQAGMVSAPAEVVAAEGFDTAGWQDAVVPGTVLTSLVHNGIYPDPYFGTNNRLEEQLIPDIATTGRDFYTYWFRTAVTIPDSYRGRRIWLQTNGINYRAEIWVNGHLLASQTGMFLRDDIEITDYARPGQKAVVAILVKPVDMPGSRMQKSWGAIGEYHNGGNGEIGFNTTQLMTAGWDFTYNDGIRDRNTGIWRPIRLYSTGAVAMRHPFVSSRLQWQPDTIASTTVSVELFNPSTDNRPVECMVTGQITGTDIQFQKKIHVGRGMHETLTFSPEEFPQLVIERPRLWWPKNKGPQNLYTLTMTCFVNGQPTDSLQTRFGIREVRTTRETPDHSKLFVVNGRPLFIKGSNWLPEAMLRTNDRRMEAELRMTHQSGINLLRLWGGGIAESDRFYELCDEYGILVWQEFWMTGDTRHPHDEAAYLANVESTVKRIRNHPSIAFYVASNESSEVSGTEALLQRIDGTRPYQQQSECDGIHDGSPYKQVNPMQHYENTASDRGSRIDGFNPEYGAPTLPLAESLRRMMPDSLLWPINKSAWDYLDGGGFHLMTTLYHDMVNEYGPSASIEEYAKKGQLVGAMNAKSIWDVWNYNQLDSGDRFCSGLLFWYHNSANPQVCARMWDYYLEPTAALYHTMHALEPLHPMFDYAKNTVSVSNDLPQGFKDYRLSATLYDMNSQQIWAKTATIDIPSEATACDIFSIPFYEKLNRPLTPVHFIHLLLTDDKGKTVAENFYWRSDNPYQGRSTLSGPTTAGFQTLAQMPVVRLKTKKQIQLSADGRHVIMTATLKNPTRHIAFFNQLHLMSDGRPVLPTYYSDNFFTLMPGAEKTVVIEAAPADMTSLSLTLEGWNVKKITI